MITETTILDRLKAETLEDHSRTESLVGIPKSVEQHIERLKRFYGFVEPWETRAAESLAPLQNELGDRRKAHLIRADLQHFGVTDSEIARLPRCWHLPEILDIPAALGSMYVLEGSTLGGQMISRHLERELSLKDGAGYSYYQSYGANVGTMWKQFREVLLRHIAINEQDQSIQSARTTFRLLGEWLR